MIIKKSLKQNPGIWRKIILLYIISIPLFYKLSGANDLLLIRSTQDFPETMAALQKAIKTSGNNLSRVQLIDEGLTKMGYKSDKYRVVFYGKLTEINFLVDKYPELIPYLPLKIAIFSENGHTLLTAANPLQLKKMYPHKNLEPIFNSWSRDLTQILDFVKTKSNTNTANR